MLDDWASDPRPVSVIGAGNFMISYDRVGPRVIELLEERGLPPDEVELISIGHAGLALLDHLHHQDLLIIVDACVYQGPPGEVGVVEPDLERVVSRESSVHQVGPLETLAAARLLYPDQMPGRILLVTVQTEGLGEDEQEVACVRVTERIEHEIASWRAERPGGRAPAAPPE